MADPIIPAIPITKLPNLGASDVASTDVLPIVDVSDVTSPGGTTKRVTTDNLLAFPVPKDGRTVSTLTDYLGHNAVFNVKDFGALGNGLAADRAAIQAAADAATEFATNTGTLGCAPVLYFPFAEGYAVDGTITVGANVSVRMDGTLLYTGTDDIAILVIGGAGSAARTTSYRYHRLSVYRQHASDWGSEDNIGILLINHIGCQIDIVSAVRNTIGVQCMGDADGFLTGFAWNTVLLRNVTDNRYQVDVTNQNNGFANENTFIGGRFTVNSDISGEHPTTERFGARITSKDQIYTGNNSNVFLKPSFEMGATYGIGLLVEYGNQNYVYRARNEANQFAMRTMNASRNNRFEASYDDGANAGLDDQSSVGGNSYHFSQGNVFPDLTREVFALRNPLAKYAPYDGTHVNVEGMAFLTSGGRVKNGTGVTPGTDYLSLGAGGTTAPLGVTVDTTTAKEFMLYMTSKNASGQFGIQCYDDAGAVIDNSDPDYPVVLPISTGTPWTYASFAGGVYVSSEVSGAPRYVKFKDAVKSAFMYVAGSTAANQLQAFAIYTRAVPGLAPTSLLTSYSAPAVIPAPGITPEMVAHQSPQTSALGTWTAGTFIRNDAPSTGGILGWLCTAGGSPGTWIAIYVPGADAIARSTVTLTDGAGAATGTLTNAPTAGNPTKWIKINDNGTVRLIPTWT